MYCAISDIEAQVSTATLIQLTDDAGTGEVSDEIVESAIDWASELIDGYLRGRYTLPLSSPYPALIVQLCADLSAHRLYERRRGPDMPDSLLSKYKTSLRLLEQLQAGKIILDVETGTSTGAGEIVTNKTSDDRVFNSDVLDRF